MEKVAAFDWIGSGGLSSVIGEIVSFVGDNGGCVGKIGALDGGIVGGAVAPTQHWYEYCCCISVQYVVLITYDITLSNSVHVTSPFNPFTWIVSASANNKVELLPLNFGQKEQESGVGLDVFVVVVFVVDVDVLQPQ